MMLDKFGLRAFLGFCFIIPNVFLAPADSSGVFVDVCANVQGKKEPVSEWGTYTRITKDQTNDFFDYIFSKIPPGTTKCKVTTDFRLSRHYASLADPNKQIFSYYCAQAAERGYEHILANMEPGKQQFIKWAESLSEFGITGAKGYPDTEYSDEELNEKKEYVGPIFDAIKDQIPEELCPEPSLQTIFYFKEKDENHLHYWKFPVACGEKADTKIEIEVMQDIENCAVKDGKLTLAFNSEFAVGNQQYHEMLDKIDPETDKQKGGCAGLSSSPMTVMVAIFVSSVAALLSL
ncbi:uncharacterized protein LOC142343241 [Convolutriloba macropyga]|uniref:uncharacterized protein LOC142343241 n=1 Tax=Convolutriloba macropyga TaxID=536237 RepID=UPI003F5210ED